MAGGRGKKCHMIIVEKAANALGYKMLCEGACACSWCLLWLSLGTISIEFPTPENVLSNARSGAKISMILCKPKPKMKSD